MLSSRVQLSVYSLLLPLYHSEASQVEMIHAVLIFNTHGE